MLVGNTVPSAVLELRTDNEMSPVGIVLEPDDGHAPVVAKQAEPSVTVRGCVGELVMFVYGRQLHSKVETFGDDNSVTAVNTASFGI